MCVVGTKAGVKLSRLSSTQHGLLMAGISLLAPMILRSIYLISGTFVFPYGIFATCTRHFYDSLANLILPIRASQTKLMNCTFTPIHIKVSGV
jgi:hypothetical protein